MANKTIREMFREGYPPTDEQQNQMEQEHLPFDPSKANTHQLLAEGFRRLLEAEQKANLDD
jgi:hypothetical protein